MRIKPLLFLCFWLLACQDKEPVITPARPAKNQDSIVLFRNLDNSEVLRRLFDNPDIRGKTAVWNPNYYERLALRVSYDDSCHTNIDTILYFNDTQDRKCAAVVFVTYRYIVDSLDGMKIRISDCHFCGAALGMALFSQNSDKVWELYKFEKYFRTAGHFGGSGKGGIGQLSLINTGDRWTALMLKEPVGGNMGELQGSADVYSLEEYNLNGFPNHTLSPILSYLYYSSQEHGGEEKTELEFIKKKKQYYSARLVRTVRGKKKVSLYRYSDEYSSYLPN